MSDKPTGDLIAVLIIAPLLTICCLGPIVFASFAAGIFSWIGGIDPLRILLVMALVAIGAFYLLRWRKNYRRDISTKKENSDE
ncbi:hypothetical protein [uncultured Sneathiella sp.]|uniref:hypothetical protein n=1 Tax=uncultured Sneathiella sp. TaxID=879315 RepID=UPI002594A255|nr:hypothetical protein [uncultured Sneathiella sp.]